MEQQAHGLEQWLEREYRRAAEAMLVSVSPVGILKTRPGFGHTIRPVKGSIVASPVLADWDPEPDYFFHWFRDSADSCEGTTSSKTCMARPSSPRPG